MGKGNSQFLNMYVLQTVPFANINRDDMGSPKTGYYGGSVRARVSSQTIKAIIRAILREKLGEEKIGKRTKNVITLVADEIRRLSPEADAESLAKTVLQNAGVSFNNDEDKEANNKEGTEAPKAADGKKGKKAKGKPKDSSKTKALTFISSAQARALAKCAVSGDMDPKSCAKAMADSPSVDMVLFGRMVAGAKPLNVEAVSQVAHAISTHAVHNEVDYYTAVDDISKDDSTGAGHVDSAEFNSSTLYRYASINLAEARDALGADTAEAVAAFVDAFVRAMPTGKIHAYANCTVPDVVYITIREDQPINLVGAFEQPVVSDEGYMAESEERLVEYAKKINECYGEPVAAYGFGDAILQVCDKATLPEITEKVKDWISSNM